MRAAGSLALIGAARDRPCTLVVCRGCCCGNARKHRETDHQRQLDRLRTAATDSGDRFTVRTTGCLGPCDQANVVVIQPSGEGRRRGGQATWMGWALDDPCTDDIARWARQGGPGLAEPPPALELHFFPPPGRFRSRPGKAARARR